MPAKKDLIESRMTVDQLARLLHKSQTDNRRGQKRYLKDIGGTGSADELDRVLAVAKKNEAAVEECERIEKRRHLMASAIEKGQDGRIAEMLADVRLHMQDQGLTQTEIGERCGWPQSLVSAYLNGVKDIGISNLAKLASALDCQWRLQPVVKGEECQ